MDINLVVFNVGNSRLAVGVFVAGELQYSARVAHAQRAEWPEQIAEAWLNVQGRETPPSSRQRQPGRWTSRSSTPSKQATGRRVEWVGKDIDLPIPVLTDEPEQTGVDRVLNVAAAYEQMGKACVVVDAGTAITVDVCNDAGRLPRRRDRAGRADAARRAARADRQAPAPSRFAAPTRPVRQDPPQQAILHGVYHGIRGMVKELVENYATELGHWPDIIATGGDAAALFDDWELVHAIAPDLTLYGIALAYTNHHIKHGT